MGPKWKGGDAPEEPLRVSQRFACRSGPPLPRRRRDETELFCGGEGLKQSGAMSHSRRQSRLADG